MAGLGRPESRMSITASCGSGEGRGDSLRQIARQLGRPALVISREVARNKGCERYRAADADDRAWDRARRKKPCKLAAAPSTSPAHSPWPCGCNENTHWCRMSGVGVRRREMLRAGPLGDSENTCREAFR